MRLADLAERIGADLEGDGDIEIDGVAPIDGAEPGMVTFLANAKYRPALATTRASAVIVDRDETVAGTAALRCTNPYQAFVAALYEFDRRPRPAAGIHRTAVIDASADIGEGAYVGACAVIGAGVRIGRDARIYPNVTIYDGVVIGDRFTAHAGAVVREEVRLGDDVVLQPGAVVGADGFGFVPVGGGDPLPIPQIGSARLDDKVEIGANSTVDRAAVGETVVGSGAKLDNLVMVAHGCQVGEGSLLAAQTGIAGSTRLGKRVMTGGQVGIQGHIELGDDSSVAAGSGVVASVREGDTVAGYPAVGIGAWRRNMVLVRRLPELLRRLRKLERRVLEGPSAGRRDD